MNEMQKRIQEETKELQYSQKNITESLLHELADIERAAASAQALLSGKGPGTLSHWKTGTIVRDAQQIGMGIAKLEGIMEQLQLLSYLSKAIEEETEEA